VAPGRKTDPGPAFDWDYYLSLLARGGDEGCDDKRGTSL